MANILGTPNDDVLTGTASDDSISGDAGNDTLIGGAGDDSLVGGTSGTFEGDRDIADYSFATGPITVHMAGGDAAVNASTVTGDASVGNDTLHSIEWVVGTAFADSYTADTGFTSGANFYPYVPGSLPTHVAPFGGYLIGTDVLNYFQGGAGNDTVNGNRSTGLVYSDATAAITADLGAGTVTGDSSVGTDIVSGIGALIGTFFADMITGSAGNETLEGGDGADTIDGGGGHDWASYQNDIAGVTVNLALDTATDGWGNTDTLINVDSVIGSAFGDALKTDLGMLRGMAGNDTLDGTFGGDADYIDDISGVAVDMSKGTAIDGWGDSDTLLNINVIRGSNFADTFIGNSPVLGSYFFGMSGNDTLTGSGGDTAGYSYDIAGVAVDLVAGTATDGWGDTDTLVGIENAYGSTFNDSLTGDANANWLRGYGGNDTLGGGGGNDTLGGGDGFDIAVYRGSRTSYSISNSGGSFTVTDLDGAAHGGDDGTDTLTGVERLQFSDMTISLVAKGDFDGDGESDLFWQNTNGALAQWRENGTSYIGGGVFSGADASWSIAGVADFNGDGASDILWQKSSGGLAVWLMIGTTYIGGGTLSGPGPGWSIAGIADFNGDGSSDILWQNGNALDLWQMVGATRAGGGMFTGAAGWTLKAVADFNGDGRADLLWQNGGALAEWQMNGTSYVGGGVFSGPGGGWALKGVADFTGDGKADLLWQNGSSLAEWYMDGVNYSGGGVLSGAGGTWSIAGLSDFNGDLKTDILWSNAGGALAEWQMNGTSYIGGGSLGPKPADWTLITSGQLVA